METTADAYILVLSYWTRLSGRTSTLPHMSHTNCFALIWIWELVTRKTHEPLITLFYMPVECSPVILALLLLILFRHSLHLLTFLLSSPTLSCHPSLPNMPTSEDRLHPMREDKRTNRPVSSKRTSSERKDHSEVKGSLSREGISEKMSLLLQFACVSTKSLQSGHPPDESIPCSTDPPRTPSHEPINPKNSL